ncbi:MAG TPA: lytic transglycosylase domain-containing protein [Gemmatimonadaceae bacterium]|nr:lytic transglycosylase domain-containing protein [Gemmatimonadaceae bacterium]
MKPLLLLAVLLIAACSRDHSASAAGDVSPTTNRDLVNAIAQNDALKAAQAAIDSGHPWRATQMLAPELKAPERRTPATLMVAARAAAGWDGWPEVDKLLAGESWVDAEFEGEGRELLARSALERGVDTLALSNTAAALRDAKSADVRAVRSVLFARALERNNYFDSAAVYYASAATALRPVHDWLALRAAGVLRDSAARAKAYASLTLPAAKARVPWTEAQTLERYENPLGAAARYASLGATVTALRLRISVAPDDARRAAIRDELVNFIRTHNGSGDAKTAIDVLDHAFPSLAPAEELVIARSAAVSGPPARAVTAFERALAQPSLVTPNDRLLYAQVLGRVNRSRDALSQLALVEGPLAGQAAYQRARLLLTSGTGDATRAALRDVVARFPADTNAASAALFLLADLATDAANDAQARAFYQQLYTSYPTSVRAPAGRFGAAMLTLIGGNARGAAAEFDSVWTLAPRADDAVAARYWSGRARAASGDTAGAKTRWREVMSQSPTSYYALVSAARLGVKPWTLPAHADSFAPVAAIDSAFKRVALLERLGMDAEARFEYDALDDAASASPERIAATAHAFLVHAQPSRTIRLAQKLIDAGQRDDRSYRLLYPVLDRDELVRDAKAHDLDPALVAGIIRQESNFNTHAVSVAGARGLMQVLPNVGEDVARSLGFPVWYPSLLFEPDANLQLGTSHLAAFIKEYGAVPRVLAAYNAGGSRVTRWAAKPGTDDPEIFAERVPFAETRDYVRIVQRNREMYKSLYGW